MRITANQNIQYNSPYNQPSFSGNKNNNNNDNNQYSVNPGMEYYTQFLKTTSASAAFGTMTGIGMYFANKKLNFSSIPKLGLKAGSAIAAASALLLAPVAKYWAEREIYDKKMDDKYDKVVLDLIKKGNVKVNSQSDI